MTIEHPTPEKTTKSVLGRRSFMTAAVGGAATIALTSVGTSAAYGATSPIPRLPGEISRLTNQVTARGGKQYENVLVSINGDLARIMIPWTAVPKSKKQIGVVWFYHASGSTHTALNSAYKYPSELCVDEGAVTICQNAGGDQYTNQIAQKAQRDGWLYMSSLFDVGLNLLRANSGGGGLACGAYGSKLLPRVRGMYLASAIYDMEKVFLSSPVRIGKAYDNDPVTIARYNPARIPASYWEGARVRVVVGADLIPDPIVPPKAHGLALVNKIDGYAVENSVRYYYDGFHRVPSWTSADMMETFKRWVS